MTDLNELAEFFESRAIGDACTVRSYPGGSWGNEEERIARRLTIAAHLRDAAERERENTELLDVARYSFGPGRIERAHYGESMVETMRKGVELSGEAWKSMIENTRPTLADYQPQEQEAPAEGEDVRIVRAVLHAHQRAMTPPDSGWGNMSYLKGSYDHLPTFQAALTAYRESVSKAQPPSREQLDQEERDHNGGFTIAEELQQEAPPQSDPSPRARPRLRDELLEIVRETLPLKEADELIVDRLLFALIEEAMERKLSFTEGFLREVKAGKR